MDECFYVNMVWTVEARKTRAEEARSLLIISNLFPKVLTQLYERVSAASIILKFQLYWGRRTCNGRVRMSKRWSGEIQLGREIYYTKYEDIIRDSRRVDTMTLSRQAEVEVVK
jgi:hypothetical protein